MNRSERHYGKIPDTNASMHEDGFYGEEQKESLELRVARYASFATLGMFAFALVDRLWPSITKLGGKKKRRKRA